MSDNRRRGGIGFFGALLLIVITLKLLGKITWPWWLILFPIWISAIFFVLSGLFLIIKILIEDREP